MNNGHVFTFGGPFRSVVAHGGSTLIDTRRVLAAIPGSSLRFMDFTIVPPGGDIGVHTHQLDNQEIYVVLSGRGEMTHQGSQIQVGPHDVVINPPGGTHGLCNIGDDDLHLLVFEVAHEQPWTPPPSPSTEPEGPTPWTVESTEAVFENPWFSVLKQKVRDPTGKLLDYHVVSFERPAVGIVARKNNRYLLIRQYRFIVDEYVWAIPSGSRANRIRHLLGYYPSYGATNQRFELFLADDVAPAESSFDTTEVMGIGWFSREEIIAMILENRVVDGLSLTPLAVLLLGEELHRD